MAQYIRLTMPKAEAEAFVREFDGLYCGVRGITHPEAERMVTRLRAAVRGKDMRAVNSKHNTHRAPRPRVELDLTRKRGAA